MLPSQTVSYDNEFGKLVEVHYKLSRTFFHKLDLCNHTISDYLQLFACSICYLYSVQGLSTRGPEVGEFVQNTMRREFWDFPLEVKCSGALLKGVLGYFSYKLWETLRAKIPKHFEGYLSMHQLNCHCDQDDSHKDCQWLLGHLWYGPLQVCSQIALR